MQLRRLAVVAVVLGLALPAVPASAKPAAKPLCQQVTDASGDGRVTPLGLTSDSVDILSADIATGANEVTAILRLKSAAVESDNYLRGGALWNFNLTAGGVKYSFFARWPSILSNPNPQLGGGLIAGNNQSTPAATFKRVGNDFLWTVSRAAMPALKKPKTYIEIEGASTTANSSGSDTAPAKPNARYLDKTPTCLPSK